MNVKFLRKVRDHILKGKKLPETMIVHRHELCPHCDGTGIEPRETSAYPPEPCSVCYGHPLIPWAMLTKD